MAAKPKNGNDSRTQIIVALIGLAGVILAAVIPIAIDRWRHGGGDGGKPDQPPGNRPLCDSGQGKTPCGVADGVTYTVMSSDVSTDSQSTYRLRLRMKVSTGNRGINFDAALFRLDTDGVKLAPDGNGSNFYVRESAEHAELIEFVIPSNTKEVKLLVGPQESGKTSTIDLPPNLLKLQSVGK